MLKKIDSEIRPLFAQSEENEIKEIKIEENKFEKTRTILESSIKDLAQIKASKKSKPETIQSAENKNNLNEKMFSLQVEDTKEIMHDINLSLEATIIEKWCDYIDIYRDYFQITSRMINEILPKFSNYKRIAQSSREQRESNIFSATSIKNPIFGIPLEKCLIVNQEEPVPLFVQSCIDWLSECALEIKDLFKSPSDPSILAQIKNKYNNPQQPNFEGEDPHIIANILKAFFNQIPEPIMTYKAYDQLIETIGMKISLFLYIY